MNKIQLHYNDLPNNVEMVGDIAIDTEAMGLIISRDRLCLVQIADEEGNIHLVQFKRDGLGGLDYSAPNLVKLLCESNRQKIFHYGRFDIAILMYYLKIERIPNIFCTKIASKFARTYTENHGLRTLVNEILSIDLRKEQQSSNWGAEELTNDQKKYASNDVIHLHKIRAKLVEMLQESGRLELAMNYSNFLHNICKADLLGYLGENLFMH